MTKERKQEIINTYKREEKDTGSPEVQIALLTERINGGVLTWKQQHDILMTRSTGYDLRRKLYYETD